MAVVSNVDDRVRNACWALEPSIKLVTYSIFKNGDSSAGLVPKVIIDTSEGTETLVSPPKTEDDHRPLYNEIKKRFQSLGSDVNFNPAPQDYITATTRRRAFCGIHFKKRWIRLDLNTSPAEANNGNRYYNTSCKPGWGYVHVSSISDLDDELMNWVKSAYNKAS
ncbi:MAG TPA: DUF5655 domain-containing protein [Nitrososphaera sp.]|nr:DUF5655 domain-containing protein [Nitrososphaera sp.]